jgi:hypothetical protein
MELVMTASSRSRVAVSRPGLPGTGLARLAERYELALWEHDDPPNPAQLNEPNLVVLPHVGSATETTRAAMVDLAAENIVAVLSGLDAPTPLPRTAARPGSARPGR